ncbi:hypothetical protein [Bacteroidaceae bacterium]|jgi:hypothetical protein
MRKILFLLFIIVLPSCIFVSCSKDDDDNSGAVSTLQMNGTPIKIYSNVDGEWDSRDKFAFWVNDAGVIIKNDGVYIQAYISKTDNDIKNQTLTINVGEDITQRLGLLLNYKQGDGYVIGDIDYLSGNVKVSEHDKTKHILTLSFENLTYDSTDDDDVSIDKVVLTGTLVIPYKVIVE